MQTSKFFTTLLFVTAFVSLTIFFMDGQAQFHPYKLMSIAAIVTFFLLNIGVYFIAKTLSNKSLDKAYTMLVYFNVMIKFALGIGIPVFFYYYYNKPEGNFIVPFLLIYVVFTIYETWMLDKMAVMRR